VIGWHHEIEQLDREAALAFYRRFYAPNNATLVIAGDVETAEVRELAQKNFGAIAALPSIPPRRIRPQEPEPAGPRTVTVADDKVEQPSMMRQYLVPAGPTAAVRERAALNVLAQALGGGSNSLLYRALVVDQGLAVSAYAWYQGTAVDPSQFSVSLTPKPGVDFPRLEAALDKVIAEVADNGIAASDLDDA
jgi:zinc protease